MVPGEIYLSKKIHLQRLSLVKNTHKDLAAKAFPKTQVSFKPQPPKVLGLGHTLPDFYMQPQVLCTTLPQIIKK
jgi:hypothetical protein